MKKAILLTLFTFSFFLTGFSQVGIGTTTPSNSSLLDIVSVDKGVLFPRVALTSLTDNTTILNGNVTSLFVFNTAQSATLSEGFYYWLNNSWRRITNTEDLENLETLTELTYDNTTDTLNYKDENGNTNSINLRDIISNSETLTILTLLPDGKTLEYQDENGDKNTTDLSTVIDNFETLTELTVDATNGNLSYKDEDNVTNTIDLKALIVAQETLTILTLLPDGKTLEYQDENGDKNTTDLSTVIDNFETLTELTVDATNGNLSYKDEDNVTNTIDLKALIVAQETLTVLTLLSDGKTLEYQDENGDKNTTDLSTVIDNFETLTELTVDVTNGNLSYKDEDNVTNNIDLKALIVAQETTTTFQQNTTTGVISYTNEDMTTANASVVSSDTNNLIAIGTDGGALLDSSLKTVDLTDDAWVNDSNNAMIKLQTLSDGTTIRTSDNLFFMRDDGRLVIGDSLDTGSFDSFITMRRATGTANIRLSASSGDAVNFLESYGDASNSIIRLAKGRGTETSQSLVQDGDRLGQMQFYGWTNGTPSNEGLAFAGAIRGEVEGIPADGDNNVPMRFTFSTSNGSSAPLERMRITSLGRIGIGENNPQSTLDISGKTRIQDLTGTDAATDVLVTADATTGELKEAGTLSSVAAINEPWFGTDDNAGATLNTEDIYSLGKIGIGTSLPLGTLHVLNDNSDDIVFSRIGGNDIKDDIDIDITRSLGTRTLPSVINQSGTRIGGLRFRAFLNPLTLDPLQSIPPIAEIASETDGTPTATSAPGKLIFQTTPNGSINTETRMTIDNQGNVGIGTDNATINAKLELNSGTANQSGMRLSQINNNSPATTNSKAIGVNTTGDIVPIQRVETVFVGRIEPDSTIDTGYQFAALESVYDPENGYNTASRQWETTTNGIYEVIISLHRIDGTMPFTQFRPNSANIIPLPTTTGQNFYYSYTGTRMIGGSVSILGSDFGIRLNNNSGSTYTFDGTSVFVNRGYWTITIKRLTRI
ncbi:hypothetical protein SAMN04489761_2079 [Tenacibaculum sp. MAR_2009_124]|uniref:hypothetical protein n=1 Tax=Tenacibaculum sp. MAR_2009_124 TaxID=1250059 RepID=UPI0008995FE4|nr:hypothetical protein [Tenacibaculum sp. MAR_2009_124]SEB95327.1 hypothetical protein SAMN04489761_2079 [Tenacibaculum sp. MAR_2009_124]